MNQIRTIWEQDQFDVQEIESIEAILYINTLEYIPPGKEQGKVTKFTICFWIFYSFTENSIIPFWFAIWKSNR